MMLNEPITGLCQRCTIRPATVRWAHDTLALTHGGIVPWCGICAAEVQLEHAQMLASQIPSIELRLAHLRTEEQRRLPRLSGEFAGYNPTITERRGLREPGWEVFCAHANEVPRVCPCPPTCGCRLTSMCREQGSD